MSLFEWMLNGSHFFIVRCPSHVYFFSFSYFSSPRPLMAFANWYMIISSFVIVVVIGVDDIFYIKTSYFFLLSNVTPDCLHHFDCITISTASSSSFPHSHICFCTLHELNYCINFHKMIWLFNSILTFTTHTMFASCSF